MHPRNLRFPRQMKNTYIYKNTWHCPPDTTEEREREKKYVEIDGLSRWKGESQEFVASEINLIKNSIHPLARYEIDESFVRKV